jgi:RimJ/RimL family protein N-acetyltransferase
VDKLDAKIRKMEHDDLERVLAWRNHPEIRRYMYTQHEITWDEHLRWFLNKKNDHLTDRVLIYQNLSEPFIDSYTINSCESISFKILSSFI